MRTTLDLDTGLLREAKKTAVERGTTLSRLLEQALRGFLHPVRSGKREPYTFRMLVVRGRRPPAVDIADRKALYDFMERHS